jgi:small-conductance mechanosensitive channel
MTLSRRWLSALILLGSALAPAVAQAQATDAPDLSELAGVIRWSGVVLSVLVLVGSGMVLRFVSSAAERLSTQFANRRLTIQKIESFTRFFIYFATAGMMISLSFRIDSTTLAMVGGASAFAVGFAMRDLVAAVIAGVTIMFDRPFQVGDRVQYAGEYGDIIQIGLRSVRMRTLDDNIVTIPNNKILTDVSSSGNYGALDMQVKMDFFVGIDQDAELADRLVRESLLTSRYVFLEKPITVIVRQVLKDEYVALQITGKGYVLDTKYEMAFVTDVNKRVLVAFRKHGVGSPAMIHRFQSPPDVAATLRRS